MNQLKVSIQQSINAFADRGQVSAAKTSGKKHA
jgi:hypothetical protein